MKICQTTKVFVHVKDVRHQLIPSFIFCRFCSTLYRDYTTSYRKRVKYSFFRLFVIMCDTIKYDHNMPYTKMIGYNFLRSLTTRNVDIQSLTEAVIIILINRFYQVINNINNYFWKAKKKDLSSDTISDHCHLKSNEWIIYCVYHQQIDRLTICFKTLSMS